MRIEEREDGTHVWLRQSWINEATLCQERGRRDVMDPTWKMQGDSACIGTAMHAGCEAFLLNHLGESHDPITQIAEEWEQMAAAPMRMTLGMTHAEMLAEAKRLFGVWQRDIGNTLNPALTVGVEEHFDVEWYSFKMGAELQRTVHVHLTGTIDLVRTEDLWDWKTAGKKYTPKEKQSNAVQPTVYAAAAVALGKMQYPVLFRYGIVLRGKDETQIVPVHRTERHEEWLKRIVEPLVRQAVVLGMNDPWPVNDTHYLCSSTWCPWWGGCKGHLLTNSDFSTPNL